MKVVRCTLFGIEKLPSELLFLFGSESSAPCVSFLWKDGDAIDLDQAVNILADIICPVLLETIIKGICLNLYLTVIIMSVFIINISF